MAKNQSTRRYWNVWIDGDARTDYGQGRDKIAASCGPCSGSGSGSLGGSYGWDVSYHNKTEKNARKIARKAARFKCAKRVRVYQDDGPDEYVKGRK